MTDDQRSKTTKSEKLPFFVLAGCLSVVLLTSVFFVGLGIGYGAGSYNASGGSRWFETASDDATIASTAKVSCERKPRDGASDVLFPEFGVFWEAMDLLYEDYNGELPQSQEATYAAVRGVLALLDDPNTSLLSPEDAEFYRTRIEGEFEGIGARVGWDQEANTLIITEPFENQPAWLAGLKRDDLIFAVDGVDITGVGLAEAVDMIRGPKGSAVLLTVERPGQDQRFDVEVVRDRIDIPTISTRSIGPDNDIAYISLSTFNENASGLVRQAVKDALNRDVAALVLDLRGNSGGLLNEAVSISSLFLEDKVVLYEEFRDGVEETYETNGRPLSTDLPMVVLVNEGSASASEIVAGALQDHDRAALIGATTFGKGSVQLPHTLSDDGIIRITIAKWLTPDGNSINGVGLEPDVIIEPAPEDLETPIDAQLDAAIAYLVAAIEDGVQQSETE